MDTGTVVGLDLEQHMDDQYSLLDYYIDWSEMALSFGLTLTPESEEYVSLIIGLYKNNGSVSCVRINYIRDPSQAVGILR